MRPGRIRGWGVWPVCGAFSGRVGAFCVSSGRLGRPRPPAWPFAMCVRVTPPVAAGGVRKRGLVGVAR